MELRIKRPNVYNNAYIVGRDGDRWKNKQQTEHQQQRHLKTYIHEC